MGNVVNLLARPQPVKMGTLPIELPPHTFVLQAHPSAVEVIMGVTGNEVELWLVPREARFIGERIVFAATRDGPGRPLALPLGLLTVGIVLQRHSEAVEMVVRGNDGREFEIWLTLPEAESLGKHLLAMAVEAAEL